MTPRGLAFLSAAAPTVHEGRWAELIALPEDDQVAAKPDGVGFARAGAAPLAALAAISALDALAPAASQAPDSSLLGDGGRLASPLGAAGEGPGRFNIMAQPTPANLQRLGELLDTGALRVPIERSYRLEQAGEALQALSTTHTQGKLSLTVA